MGGEYLPEMRKGEVEITRVSLKSTTGDQISVRTRRWEGKIVYRVVGEYESEFDLVFVESDRPLSLAEMIDFLDKTDQADYEYDGGLIQVYWEDPYGSPDERRDFVSVESAFYPGLTTYYTELRRASLILRREEDEEE